MRKASLALLAFAAGLFLPISCGTTAAEARRASQEKYSNYDASVWNGKSRNKIMQAFGVPDREASDGAGGAVLVYEDVTCTVTSTTEEDTHFGLFDTEYKTKKTSSEKRKYAEFFLDASGSCYFVRTNLRRWQFEHPEQRPWQ